MLRSMLSYLSAFCVHAVCICRRRRRIPDSSCVE